MHRKVLLLLYVRYCILGLLHNILKTSLVLNKMHIFLFVCVYKLLWIWWQKCIWISATEQAAKLHVMRYSIIIFIEDKKKNFISNFSFSGWGSRLYSFESQVYFYYCGTATTVRLANFPSIERSHHKKKFANYRTERCL